MKGEKSPLLILVNNDNGNPQNTELVMNLLSTLKSAAGVFGANRKPNSRPSLRRTTLTLEALEQRDVPSAASLGFDIAAMQYDCQQLASSPNYQGAFDVGTIQGDVNNLTPAYQSGQAAQAINQLQSDMSQQANYWGPSFLLLSNNGQLMSDLQTLVNDVSGGYDNGSGGGVASTAPNTFNWPLNNLAGDTRTFESAGAVNTFLNYMGNNLSSQGPNATANSMGVSTFNNALLNSTPLGQQIGQLTPTAATAQAIDTNPALNAITQQDPTALFVVGPGYTAQTAQQVNNEINALPNTHGSMIDLAGTAGIAGLDGRMNPEGTQVNLVPTMNSIQYGQPGIYAEGSPYLGQFGITSNYSPGYSDGLSGIVGALGGGPLNMLGGGYGQSYGSGYGQGYYGGQSAGYGWPMPPVVTPATFGNPFFMIN